MLHRVSFNFASFPTVITRLVNSCGYTRHVGDAVMAGDVKRAEKVLGSLDPECSLVIRSSVFSDLMDKNQALIILSTIKQEPSLFVLDVDQCSRLFIAALSHSTSCIENIWNDISIYPVADIHLANCVMNKLVIKKQTSQSDKLYTFMKASKTLQPNAITFNYYLKGIVERKLTKKGAVVYSQKNPSFLLDQEVYHKLIILFSNNEAHYNQCKKVYQEMVNNNIKPSLLDVTPLIRAACSLNDIKYALFLIGEMKTHNIQPDGFILTNMISALCNAADFTRAIAIHESRKDVNSSIFDNSIIFGLSKSKNEKDIHYALKILMRLPKKQLSVKLYTCVISALLNMKQLRLANGVQKKMEQNGFASTLILTNKILQATLSEQLEDGFKLYKKTIASGNANVFTYNITLSFCFREKDEKKACEVLKDMKERHVSHDDHTKKILTKDQNYAFITTYYE